MESSHTLSFLSPCLDRSVHGGQKQREWKSQRSRAEGPGPFAGSHSYDPTRHRLGCALLISWTSLKLTIETNQTPVPTAPQPLNKTQRTHRYQLRKVCTPGPGPWCILLPAASLGLVPLNGDALPHQGCPPCAPVCEALPCQLCLGLSHVHAGFPNPGMLRCDGAQCGIWL